jgi:nicotinamidase-related amidase
MKTALVIIDLQQGSFTPDIPRYAVGGLVDRLNSLADAVRARDGSVVFVQHDGLLGDPHHPDLPGWRLLPDLQVRARDLTVRKTARDAFLGTTLDTTLRSLSVDQLAVTGCATDYCVDTTVRSALARGYATIVPMDGHATSDRPHLSARKIIEHHNAIWADFIAPAGPAIVCHCADVPLA